MIGEGVLHSVFPGFNFSFPLVNLPPGVSRKHWIMWYAGPFLTVSRQRKGRFLRFPLREQGKHARTMQESLQSVALRLCNMTDYVRSHNATVADRPALSLARQWVRAVGNLPKKLSNVDGVEASAKN